MNKASAEPRAVVVERDFPHSPERIWRALTQPELMAEWLMQNDFAPITGHRFDFRADWGTVACRVIEVEPYRLLSYSWAAMGLDSVVTWILTRTGTGTHVRLEQAGFRPDQEQAFRGANFGWQRFLAKLEEVLPRAM